MQEKSAKWKVGRSFTRQPWKPSNSSFKQVEECLHFTFKMSSHVWFTSGENDWSMTWVLHVFTSLLHCEALAWAINLSRCFLRYACFSFSLRAATCSCLRIFSSDAFCRAWFASSWTSLNSHEKNICKLRMRRYTRYNEDVNLLFSTWDQISYVTLLESRQ